jgi:hypothetical protein
MQQIYNEQFHYDAKSTTNRQYQRQIQVPLPSRYLALDTRGVRVDTNTSPYSGTLDLRSAELIETTTLSLQSIRGILSIPNVIAGRNNTITYVIGSDSPRTLELEQGFYTLTRLVATIADDIKIVTAVEPVVTYSAENGTASIDIGVSHTIHIIGGNLTNFPGFARIIEGPSTHVISIKDAWLYYTRYVTIECPELTKHVTVPVAGNLNARGAILQVIAITNPCSPSFIESSFNWNSYVLPMIYENRISQCTFRLSDEHGIPLANYCTGANDWMMIMLSISN